MLTITSNNQVTLEICLMSEDKQEKQGELDTWRKKIEMIGIDIKSLDPETETGRFKLKTRFMNQHFINELDKIGLQLINITGNFMGKLTVLLEAKV
jgi:hypothetical protein